MHLDIVGPPLGGAYYYGGVFALFKTAEKAELSKHS